MLKKPEVIYAFIDSQNLNLSVQKDLISDAGEVIYEGWKLDFKRFRVYLKDKFGVDKAFLFIGRVDGNEDLYNFLDQAGYILIFKPTLNQGGVTKGNVDGELVLHTMIEYPNFTKAIIVSGDGDYHCLIEYLVKKGKLARLIIPNKHSFSSLLRKFRKYMVFISDLRGKLEYKRKKRE